MIPGFIEINRQRFYGEIWPRIRAYTDSMKSNWDEVHACKKAKLPAPELYIYWGYKNQKTEEKIIVAVTTATTDNERHWIAPHLDK